MDLTYFLMILFYWFFLSGVVFVAGAFLCRVYITGPSGADVCIPSSQRRCLGDEAALIIFSIALLVFFINLAHVVLHCAVMTETPLGEVFSVLPTFITKTKYGKLSILRTVILFLLAAAAFIDMKKNSGWTKTAGIASSFALLVVIGMSGHQGAGGYFNLLFSVDILHLVSVSLWIGGLFFVRFCYSFFFLYADISLWEVFRALMNRFSRLATYCVVVAGLTGLVLSLYNLESVSLILNTQYGIILLLKAVLVGIIVLLGGANKFVILPALNREMTRDQGAALKPGMRLHFVVTTEVFLGFLVLLLTSLLTHLSPEE